MGNGRAAAVTVNRPPQIAGWRRWLTRWAHNPESGVQVPHLPQSRIYQTRIFHEIIYHSHPGAKAFRGFLTKKIEYEIQN